MTSGIRIPNPDDPNTMMAGSTKGQEDSVSTSIERIERYLNQLEGSYENLPVDLKLAAIGHLMQQNPAEFMHYIEYLYGDLQKLHGDLRGQVERQRKERGESKMLKEQNVEAGADMDMNGYEADEDRAQQGREREVDANESRSQPEPQPEKKMAFGKRQQLAQVEQLMQKMEMAMGMQPKFNPTPMR